MDEYAFVPASFPADNLDIAGGSLKFLAEKFAKEPVGFSIDWWCGQINLQPIIDDFSKPVLRCPGLHPDIENQMLRIPAKKRHYRARPAFVEITMPEVFCIGSRRSLHDAAVCKSEA